MLIFSPLLFSQGCPNSYLRGDTNNAAFSRISYVACFWGFLFVMISWIGPASVGTHSDSRHGYKCVLLFWGFFLFSSIYMGVTGASFLFLNEFLAWPQAGYFNRFMFEFNQNHSNPMFCCWIKHAFPRYPSSLILSSFVFSDFHSIWMRVVLLMLFSCFSMDLYIFCGGLVWEYNQLK